MAERQTGGRGRSRQVVRQGGPAVTLSAFVPPPRALAEQTYKPGGVLGDDDLGTIHLLPGDGEGDFDFMAGIVDIGSTRVEGLYFTIWLGNHFSGFETPEGTYEAALLLGGDVDGPTYDGWHVIDPNSPQLHWGVDVLDRFTPPQMPFQPGPRPSGTLALGLRGNYPNVGLTLAVREWRLTTVRLAS